MSETEAAPQPVVETVITLTADLAISYAAIITMAIVPIVLGSRKAAEALNLDALVSSVSTSQNLSVKMETMSKKDATMFPVIGSGVLLGLYLLFHFFSKEYINYLLSAYFFIFGVSALASSFTPFVIKFLPLSDQTQVPFPNFLKKIVELVLRTKLACSLATLIAAIPATIIAAVYGITKNWLLNNLLGLCFSVEGVALLSPGSFKIAAQLLIGLFLYDIFWVFGTDVMVTVAKNFDAPIKLLFPKNLLAGEEFKFAMLGLGDIVIPGIFIAMMLRFDISRAINDAKKSGKKLTFSSISKPYYNSTLVAYFLGLATTIGVMHLFRHAQPALLYLVPFCLLFPVVTSLVRGEFSLLFQYAEDNEDEQEEKEKNDKAASSDAAITTATTAAETKKTD